MKLPLNTDLTGKTVVITGAGGVLGGMFAKALAQAGGKVALLDLNQEAAKKAFLDMFEFYNVPFTPLMEKDIWFTDFGLGDFEHVGMGGIFWVNDPEYGYFAHHIYLLPGQMIPEHAHVKTKFPAKHESWMVNHGWVYNFSEIGEETPNAPEIPAGHGPIKSKNFTVQKVGDVLRLKEMEFFQAKPSDLDGIVSVLRQTRGVDVAILLYELEQQTFKVSLRSKEIDDVSAVAKYYGGGGHVRAAGVTMKGSPHDVINNLTLLIERQLRAAEEKNEEK